MAKHFKIGKWRIWDLSNERAAIAMVPTAVEGKIILLNNLAVENLDWFPEISLAT